VLPTCPNDENNTHCWRFGAVPKVLVTMRSLVPTEAKPQMHTELSGMLASGKAALVYPGAVVALTSKVRMPEVLTLNWVTALPLN
jgi:hypothetical protein